MCFFFVFFLSFFRAGSDRGEVKRLAEYISLSLDTVYSRFLYRQGCDLSTHHLAGQDTTSSPEWKSSRLSAETLRTLFVLCFIPL